MTVIEFPAVPPPFIIWTLQRTGGTNLAMQLMNRAPQSKKRHEPFNVTRPYGHITKNWKQTSDRPVMKAAVEDICSQHVLIKHCVETVPRAVTMTLARVAADTGYRHLFLYRRNAADRLLSLYFARKTGIWGPKMKQAVNARAAMEDGNSPSVDVTFKETSDAQLPVARLIAHEKRCASNLSLVWNALTRLDAHPLAVAYEDIYFTEDSNQVLRVVSGLLSHLGLSTSDDEDRQFAANLRSKGDLGLRDQYAGFSGVDALKAELAKIAIFDPQPGQA